MRDIVEGSTGKIPSQWGQFEALFRNVSEIFYVTNYETDIGGLI